MATHLDLEEQEQLEQLKQFWKQYGNLITWVLIAVLGGFAAFNGWNWWQARQAAQASGLYDAIAAAAGSQDVDRVQRAFDDLRSGYGGTTFAQQGGLLAARVLYEGERVDASQDALAWVTGHGPDSALRAVARLRLAALLQERERFDEALQVLAGEMPPEFDALREDRRGDVLLAQGRNDEARQAFERAYRAMEANLDYRQLVEAKWMALGGKP